MPASLKRSSFDLGGEVRRGLYTWGNAISARAFDTLPDRDVFGQLRVDDPNVSTPSGQGSNVFKDRGAQDRADEYIEGLEATQEAGP